MRNIKGISLITLSIAVIVTLVITGTLIYNIRDNLKVSNLQEMQTDIENLRDKVNSYYVQYGTIPVNTNVEYTSINELINAGAINNVVDTGKFYIIDLEAIENITLNYGKDYQKYIELKNNSQLNTDNINELKDIYIINANSQNIFFVKGIQLDGEMFYTDSVSEDIKKVKLEYVEGVEIPEGFYYVGGTKQEGLVISDVEGDNLKNSKRR